MSKENYTSTDDFNFEFSTPSYPFLLHIHQIPDEYKGSPYFMCKVAVSRKKHLSSAPLIFTVYLLREKEKGKKTFLWGEADVA
ncbi:Hypothetical predicted protein [Podarcis lilfordi]|uniref:Uncharacterized protein n=1 Tax=Podarcis lilfordi TaxID=74358 RepID=A0AA35L3X4_9SAUR|nr:Hypothetical predicted protein [Podarcis lilfordi]